MCTCSSEDVELLGSDMKTLALIFLLLVVVGLGRCCFREGNVLICHDIPTHFEAGCLSLVMFLNDVGVINSSVFNNENLTTITRVSINDAGVTGVSEAAFAPFHSLRALSLERNLLTQVHDHWFGEPATLTELSLTGNHIHTVNELMLRGFSGLTSLRMNKNQIKSISPDGFSSQSLLAELDLSENKLTQISENMFSSLSSTSIRLYGNQWDCSCDSEESIASLKELHSRLVLERPMDVVCESPPALRGQPVLSVSQCATGPPSHTVAPASAAGTSLHPLLTDGPPEYSSSHSDLSMTVISTTSALTSSHIAPSELCRPPGASGLSTVGALVAVIGLLCACVLVCVLVLLHRSKTNNKVATPQRPTQETQQNIESSLGSSEMPEVAEKKSYGGVRAKSANAVILTSPFCVAEKDHVTVEHETEAETLNQELETKAGETGNRRDDSERTNEGPGTAAENPDGNTHSASVFYFSVGTSSHPHHRVNAGQRSREGKAMCRISTWPVTAAQWKARSERKEEEEEEKSSEEGIPTLNNTVCPSSSQQSQPQTAAQSVLTETTASADLHQHGLVQTVDVNHGPVESSIQSEQRMRPQPGVSSTAVDDGSELAFRNLLHEVVQNHGRWTRERWRQMHVNKQRP